MSGNPLAGTARVGWMEFLSHAKSPRLIVLVVLLALLVFGVSYGLSQPSPFEGLDASLAVHPAVRNVGGTNHYLVIGWLADGRGLPRPGLTVSVYRQNLTNPSGDPFGTVIGNLTTNVTGFVEYDTGTLLPQTTSYAMRYVVSGSAYTGTSVTFEPIELNQTFTLGTVTSGGISGPTAGSFFSLHAMTIDGYPATGANVSVDGSFKGHPDGNGFFITPLSEGEHLVDISYRGQIASFPLRGGSPGGPVYENGADAVLISLAGTFMQLILPIMAIAVSFDAIARERAQGSLELLLAHRVRREGILAGKFLGAFGAVAVPTLAVLLAGIAIVTVVSGRAPTASFALVVLAGSLFLIAVYVLLMLLFSTLAKSVGTAVVLGVVVWLLFNVLFSFLASLLLVGLVGNSWDAGFYRALLTTYLFDPNLVFQLMLGASVPLTGGGLGVGIVPTGYVPVASIAIAAVLWVLLPLTLAILAFRKTAET